MGVTSFKGQGGTFLPEVVIIEGLEFVDFSHLPRGEEDNNGFYISATGLVNGAVNL